MKERRSSGPLVPILAALVSAFLLKSFVVDLAVVEGSSMLPTFRQGQVVVVLRAAYGLRMPPGIGGYLFRWSSPRPGQIVVACNPQSGVDVIKRVQTERRVAAVSGDMEERVFIVGDNPPESLDSRDYGEVSVEKIAGRVLLFGQLP